MNSIIKKLNESFNAGVVTFKQMDACLWIDDKYKIEMKRISNNNKQLKNNWKMVKSFLNEEISILNSLISMSEPEELIEHRALLIAYQNTLSTMKNLENTEALNEN